MGSVKLLELTPSNQKANICQQLPNSIGMEIQIVSGRSYTLQLMFVSEDYPGIRDTCRRLIKSYFELCETDAKIQRFLLYSVISLSQMEFSSCQSNPITNLQG